jgi:hypothetical protein
VADGEADPPVLAVKARQRLRDRQADQLGLAQPNRMAWPAVFHQHVVDLDVLGPVPDYVQQPANRL